MTIFFLDDNNYNVTYTGTELQIILFTLSIRPLNNGHSKRRPLFGGRGGGTNV